MPRIMKCRKICFEPTNKYFFPKEDTEEAIIFSMEEIEALRLVDKEEMEQTQAAQIMEVSRATFQRILYTARYKSADALSQGKMIKIEGGNYQVSNQCNCHKKCSRCINQNLGGSQMKIAVTTENGMVFQHFGHSKEFTIYEVENEKVKSKENLDTGASGHGALADVLKLNSVDILICGGIGAGAKNALREKRIEIVPGVEGKADEMVVKYLSGEKIGNPDLVCTHHHEHGEEGDCAHNGCGRSN